MKIEWEGIVSQVVLSKPRQANDRVVLECRSANPEHTDFVTIQLSTGPMTSFSLGQKIRVTIGLAE